MSKTYKSTRKSPQEVSTGLHMVVEEPTPFPIYQTSYMQQLLGFNYTDNNSLQMIQASRLGIKKDVLVQLANKMGITQEVLCKIIHISPRTFQRIPANEPLDIFTSQQAIEMAQVIDKALEIFEDETNMKLWLQSPLQSLGGLTPLSFLDTGFGVQLVLETLGRIAYGVYS